MKTSQLANRRTDCMPYVPRLMTAAVFSFLVLLAAAPLTSRAALVLDLSDGGGSVVNYQFSGSTTITAGYTVTGPEPSSALRLPENGNWSSYFSEGDFDNPGSELLGVTNVTSGVFSASGLPVLSVNGSQVEKVGGGFASEGEWTVEFTSDPAFRFYIRNGEFDFSYPALSGGEVLTISGAGSFDMGAGSFTSNFNVGSYNFTGASSIVTRVNVVPEPSSVALLGLGAAGVVAWRARRKVKS